MSGPGAEREEEALAAPPAPRSRPGRLGALRRALGARVDGASLAALRAAFGGVMTLAIVRFAAMGWIDELYVAPRHHLHYFGLGWVAPLPAPWIHLHFALTGMAAACVALGLHYRVAIVAFVVLFGWVELLDAATYLNHYYAITLVGLLLAVMPAERVLSLDAWRARRAARPLPATVPRWTIDLLRFQIGVVYLFAGLAKLQPDWLFRAEPLRTWLLSRSDFPVLGPLFSLEATAFVMSWAGALFDLGVPFALLSPRLRPWAFVAVVGFHLSTGALFSIGVFPLVMIGLTPIFFAPDWPRRVLRRLGAAPPLPAPAPVSPAALALLAGWALVQLVVPLRHHLYPGDGLWNQAGMRWSWHVMVAERAARLELTAIDDDDHRWVVRLEDYLTPLQARMAATEPDLLLELAHLVRDDHRAHGRRVRVYADDWVSLNGRPARPLVDPTVDLAAEERGLTPARWVLEPD